MEIKRFDVDENGNVIIVCDINDISEIIRDCTQETETYNERTRDEIEKFVNDMIKTNYLSILSESLDFLKKFKINIDTNAINISDYDFFDIVRIYQILIELNAMTDEIKNKIKDEIITKYNSIYEIDNIYKIISIAIENNDREFAEFLVKNVVGNLLSGLYRNVGWEFRDWLNGKIYEYSKFGYLIRILETIFENNLERLIENEIKIFRKILLRVCEENQINLKYLLKRRINSKLRDDAIVLIKVLDDDELKRYLIMSSLNE